MDQTVRRAVVITSINQPTRAVEWLGRNCRGWPIVVVGDEKTPSDWSSGEVTFLSLTEQLQNGSQFARALPTNSYARKNLGYLHAIAGGAEAVVDLDDDNVPYASFLETPSEEILASPILDKGWINVYRLFTDEKIWPRGFPLEAVGESLNSPPKLGATTALTCWVQQFLADGDPDVDSIWRLIFGRPEIDFRQGAVGIGAGSSCPFNSQNTLWWSKAFPLMYLPSHTAFRVTDIWRSFVAQRCLEVLEMWVGFLGPNVRQERNDHSLIKDFEDEVPGFIHNSSIVELLRTLRLGSHPDDIPRNLRMCYESLVSTGLIPDQELVLLDLWLDELRQAELAGLYRS